MELMSLREAIEYFWAQQYNEECADPFYGQVARWLEELERRREEDDI
jgi:hypothetical protein